MRTKPPPIRTAASMSVRMRAIVSASSKRNSSSSTQIRTVMLRSLADAKECSRASAGGGGLCVAPLDALIFRHSPRRLAPCWCGGVTVGRLAARCNEGQGGPVELGDARGGTWRGSVSGSCGVLNPPWRRRTSNERSADHPPTRLPGSPKEILAPRATFTAWEMWHLPSRACRATFACRPAGALCCRTGTSMPSRAAPRSGGRHDEFPLAGRMRRVLRFGDDV
jgi:hypothetical protein